MTETMDDKTRQRIINLESTLLNEFSAGWETDIPDRKVIRDAFKEFWKPYEVPIEDAIDKRIDKGFGVYTDELMKDLHISREALTTRLKKQGFTKPGGHTSRRWENRTWWEGRTTHEHT